MNINTENLVLIEQSEKYRDKRTQLYYKYAVYGVN